MGKTPTGEEGEGICIRQQAFVAYTPSEKDLLMAKLKNVKHERFCQEYIKDLNGYKSALRAKYSKKTAKVQASQILTKLNVQERIAELQEKRSKRTEITQDKVLKELALVGFSDFADYAEIDENGLTVKAFGDIETGKTRAIKSVKEVTGDKSNSMSFKLHDKIKPLELIGRHLGMFVEESIVNFKGTLKVVSAVPRPNNNNRKNSDKKEKSTNSK